MKFKQLLKLLLSFILIFPVMFNQNIQAEELDINISSPYAYLYDLENGQVLYDKNGEEKIYPASMTKLMTALIAVEHLDLDQKILITSEMYAPFAGINASVAGFSIGEEPTVRDLLYGLLLPSGADSACVLAYAVAGNIDSFVLLMNDKVNELNLENTHFTNTTGLHNPNQYSTCKDIARICSEVVQYDAIKEILETKNYTTGPLLHHPDGLAINDHISDTLRYGITGFVGGKTGYTPDAGRCLASYAVVNGMPCILVTAAANDSLTPQNDAYETYNYLTEYYTRTVLIDPNEILKTIPVKGGKKVKEISVNASSSCNADIPINSEISTSIDLPDKLQAPLSKDTQIGTITVSVDENEYCSSAIYIQEDIAESIPSIIFHFIENNFLLLCLLFIIFVLLFIKKQIAKQRRRKRRKKRNTTKKSQINY